MSTPLDPHFASADFLCYVVTKDAAGKASGKVERRPIDDLPPGEVTIRVRYSSLNYKDALSATGNPGVSKNYPHVPGIDAAGVVVASQSDRFRVGDDVIVTGYELGASRWGGYAQFVRVPADWIVALPPGLTLRESMILGTAGFTAAQCVAALHERGVLPANGDVVVTGASGGVGSLAVALLAQLGYSVVAVSGKPAAAEFLRVLGARDVISRGEVDDHSTRPLLSSRWAGAVDTVGGNTLATVLRSLKLNGCAAACGMVGGVEMPVTVFPFLLRGASLIGIDSAWRTHDERIGIWSRLASSWKLANLEAFAKEIELGELEPWIGEILAGRVMGRVVVRVSD
jgi:acrylyl-CoA reductase (NADPH)